MNREASDAQKLGNLRVGAVRATADAKGERAKRRRARAPRRARNSKRSAGGGRGAMVALSQSSKRTMLYRMAFAMHILLETY